MNNCVIEFGFTYVPEIEPILKEGREAYLYMKKFQAKKELTSMSYGKGVCQIITAKYEELTKQDNM